jgi:hypothetical protein
MFNGAVPELAGIRLTEADLRAAAGERAFERGLEYVNAVEGLHGFGAHWTATVHGTEDYLVVLYLEPSGAASARIRGQCSCPQGLEGFFCKHCVAVGLGIARTAASAVPAQRGPRATHQKAGPKTGRKGLDEWLDGRSRDELHLLVIQHAAEDLEWRRHLELRAAIAAADQRQIDSVLTELLAVPEDSRLPYGAEPDQRIYARQVRAAGSGAGQLADAGHPEEAIATAQLAMRLIIAGSRTVRDDAGTISEAAADLAAIHKLACQLAPPDPGSLADFLAEIVLSGSDAAGIDFADYVALLGRAGLTRLQDQLIAAWHEQGADGWPEQLALEALLRAAGDTDALIGVIEAGLDRDDTKQLRIARELDAAGRQDEALDRAERGLRGASVPGQQLTDFVAGRYRALNRAADAVLLRRDRFAAARDLDGYSSLREDAQAAGEWPAAREWALGLLRADAAARSGPGTQGRTWQEASWPPGPVLIDVLIDEGDLDAAWDAARGIASEAQWLRLADLVAESRPADALAVYLRQIEPLRAETGERAYQRMARLLAAARACHAALGAEAAFGAYLAALRAEQRRKRKLISILDKRHLR